MKAIRSILAAAGMIFFFTLLPNTASARVNFHIGIGADFGHCNTDFRIGCGPHIGFHGGYYRWPDRGHKVFGYRHFGRHRHSPEVSVRIDGLFPIIVRPPVVIKAPKVIRETRVVVEEPESKGDLEGNKDTAELFEKLRMRKSELLKKLRIGDKDKRKETIWELAGFSFDNKVREALEDILLSDPDPELRRQAAESFGKTTNKKVLPALEIASTDDPSIEVRQEAYKAIVKIRGYNL